MTKWEYKTIKVVQEPKGIFGRKNFDPDKELNALGEEGWELVSTHTVSVGSSKGGIQAIFKRPKV